MDKHKDDKSKSDKTENGPTPGDTADAAKPEPEPSKKRELDPASDFDDFVDTIKADEDMSKFSLIYMLAHEGMSKDDFKDELKRRQFLADFEAWKKAGKPGISMPKLPKSEIKFPTAIYRIRDRTVDYMYAYFSDTSEEGIKYIPKYEQLENPETGEMEDSKIKIGQTETYDLKFDAKKAKQLIEAYNKLAPPGTNPLQLYIWIGNNKQQISETNFYKSYEEIVDLFNNKKPLN